MPDLNELLKWSILNSTQGPNASASNQSSATPEGAPEGEQGLSLRFNPSTTSHSNPNSALHPNDPQYRISHGGDISPASTPGPLTPVGGNADLPNPALPRGVRSVQESNEILEMLMGKPDSVTMREKLDFARDESMSVDDRVSALDDFEMLVELIDNANNLVALKMWEPLLELLNSTDDPIVAHTCWIIGTAIQNNLTAQAAFFAHNALPPVLALVTSSRPTSVRAKAVYALSASLKHWPLASSALSSSSSAGYNALSAISTDSEKVIRRKAAFLIGTLVMQSGEVYEGEIPKPVVELIQQRMDQGETSEPLIQGLKSSGVLTALVKGLMESEGDVEYEENAIKALAKAAESGALDREQVGSLKGLWQRWGPEGQKERGLDGQDGKDVEKALA